LAAIVKAFSISWLIRVNVSRISSEGVVAVPVPVFAPHFEQKRASFGSSSPQLMQYVINLPQTTVVVPEI
jgi:hypothetical protein